MLITLRQAEQRTGVSRATFLQHINAGTIVGTKEKNRYLIEESELTKLPKPRNTGTHQAMDEREVPQGVPFSVKREDSILMEAIRLYQQIENNRQQIEINRQKDQVFIQNLIASQL